MPPYPPVVPWPARDGRRHYTPPARPWHAGKTRASFADMPSTPRGRSVKHEVPSMRPHGPGSRNVVKLLIHAVKQAAYVRNSN